MCMSYLGLSTKNDRKHLRLYLTYAGLWFHVSANEIEFVANPLFPKAYE